MSGLEIDRLYMHYYLWRKEGFSRVKSIGLLLRYVVSMIKVNYWKYNDRNSK